MSTGQARGDTEPLSRTLGARLRDGREAAGLSVRELARRIGVSPSLVSQIERGLAQPSVGTLWAVVSELGLSLDAVFPQQENGAPSSPGRERGPAAVVQPAAGRAAIELEGGVRWERLTAGADPDADFAFVTYPPGASSGTAGPPARHRGKEYGYVVTGRLEIEAGDEVLELGPGDSIVLHSEVPHRFRALGDEPVQTVWLNVPRVL